MLKRYVYQSLLVILLISIQIASISFMSSCQVSYCFLPGIIWLVFLWALFSNTEQKIIVTHFGMLLTLLFIWLSLVGLWSKMSATHYYFYSYMLSWPLIYWIYMLRSDLNRAWHQLFFGLATIGIICASTAIYQYLILHQIPRGFFPDKNTQSTMANLLAFPLLAYAWIFASNKEGKFFIKLVLALAIILLFLSVTITGSRGATLGAIFGVAIFILLLRKQITLKYCIAFGILILLPILYGIFFGWYAKTDSSFASLLHPINAGANRFILWQPTWVLIKEYGWHGIGLGNFYWYLPALRSPLDTSAGLYVHNDYLQIWLEGGIIGIILLLSALLSLSVLIIKFIYNRTIVDAKKIEVAGLGIGIATVLFYSCFTFTLYLMPILILLGLYCGRLHYLIKDELSLKEWKFNAANYTRKSIFYLLGIVIALVLSLYYFSAAAALWLSDAGDHSFATKKFDQAARYYYYADLLQANKMEVLTSEVKFYSYLSAILPSNDILSRWMLYMQLKARYDVLTAKYPLYAYPYVLQANYYTQNPTFAGKQPYCVSKKLYQQALQLAPLSIFAQHSYSDFIKKFGDKPC